MTAVLEGCAALPHLGVIRVEGEDAASFLQGQLTNDFALLRGNEARLAAHCTPKGRMLASFIGLRMGDAGFLLVTPKETLAASLKRLSMFVLRAKAKLSDASAEFELRGLAGALPIAQLSGQSVAAVNAAAPWARRDEGAAAFVSLYPADRIARALWIAPAGTPAPAVAALDTQAWHWGEVRSGVAMINSATVEAFVPQMLNYESVGGVNFRKGCYPGQEVVARSQFRGTLKRRAFVARSAGELKAGEEVFHSSDREQPCGLVAQAAASPAGGWDAIVSLQLSATHDGTLTAHAPDGPLLQLEPLPYALLADV